MGRVWTVLLATAMGVSGPAAARNVVLGNDDGLTSNVLALYQALKARGDDVIVAVPCTNQSGMGAAAYYGRALVPLTAACRNGAAVAGDPAVGPMTRSGLPAADFHYVAGTPVMALYYGIDVVARKRWGRLPDLVLSGPNEGQNVGAVVLGSGTVSVAQVAALRGIPAIALSAGVNSTGTDALDNPVSRVVARRAVELVAELDRVNAGKPMLPAGVALNVNFPDKSETAPWRPTRLGSYNAYIVRFSENLARDTAPEMRAMAEQHGATIPELPGLVFERNGEKPTAAQADDEAAVYRSAIAVSAMRAGYDNESQPWTGLQKLLGGLFRKRR